MSANFGILSGKFPPNLRKSGLNTHWRGPARCKCGHLALHVRGISWLSLGSSAAIVVRAEAKIQRMASHAILNCSKARTAALAVSGWGVGMGGVRSRLQACVTVLTVSPGLIYPFPCMRNYDFNFLLHNLGLIILKYSFRQISRIFFLIPFRLFSFFPFHDGYWTVILVILIIMWVMIQLSPYLYWLHLIYRNCSQFLSTISIIHNCSHHYYSYWLWHY